MTLKSIVRALAALEVAKKTAAFIPGVGVGALAVSTATTEAMRSMAKVIAQTQDWQLKLARAKNYGIYFCGIPNKIHHEIDGEELALDRNWLGIERPYSFEATLAQTPGPLTWETGPAGSVEHLNSRDFKTEAFGHCRTPSRPTTPLSGERYTVSFQLPDRQDKPALRSLPF